MTYESFRCNSSKEFLGYCDQIKSYIYSVKLDSRKYAVVALQNGNIRVLISYAVQASRMV
jgi:hypothetical protein